MDGRFGADGARGPAISMVLVADNRALADALLGAFRRDPGIGSVRHFSTLAAAAADIRRAGASCALIEAATLRGEHPREQVRRLRSDLRVVLYGLDEGPETILRWARVGAAGFVPRTLRAGDVVEATKAAARGEPHCSARVVAALLSALSEDRPALGTPADGLTVREREVARLAVRGHCNKRIARALGIETSTAKTHMHNILRKTRLRNRRELEVWYRRQASLGGAAASGG